MQPSTITLACIGAGAMARNHLQAFGAVPGVALAGIHSRTPAKAAEVAADFSIDCVASSVRDLFEQTRASVVVVAVSVQAMRHVAECCFAFPWTVVLEKPPGRDLAEAKAIQRAAQEAAGPVYVGLNRRFLGSCQSARAALDSDSSTRFIHATDQQDLQAAARFGHPAEIIQNWMFANSIHVIDLLRSFGRGRVKDVTPIVKWKSNDPGVVLTHVRFESGDHGVYEGIWNGPGPWAIAVTTPTQRWELRPLERAAKQSRGERAMQTNPPDPRDEKCKPGLLCQAEEIVAAVRGQASQAVPLNAAIETMELIERIFRE